MLGAWNQSADFSEFHCLKCKLRGMSRGTLQVAHGGQDPILHVGGSERAERSHVQSRVSTLTLGSCATWPGCLCLAARHVHVALDDGGGGKHRGCRWWKNPSSSSHLFQAPEPPHGDSCVPLCKILQSGWPAPRLGPQHQGGLRAAHSCHLSLPYPNTVHQGMGVLWPQRPPPRLPAISLLSRLCSSQPLRDTTVSLK